MQEGVVNTYYLPIRTYSLTNIRVHWAAKAKRAKAQRKAAVLVSRHELPCTVTLTRIAPRTLDDDNLRGALKSCRDGIADRLGIDDRDPRVTWEYAQERGKPREYGVRVEIR